MIFVELCAALIFDAELALLHETDDLGRDGLQTYVDASKVQSANPGYCFIRAGWRRDGHSKRYGLHRLRKDA